MGMQDRDWWKEAQKERARKKIHSNNTALPGGLKWGPTAMGLLYAGMTHYLQPKPVSISATGDLVIPRARDGHFYASGRVNGKPVNFLVDTGASLVTVSEEFAKSAGISTGVPTLFKTANGDLRGRIVSGIPITLGPVSVSSVRVGVGLVGDDAGNALLGQSFLSRFEIVLSKEQMILRHK